MRKTPHSPPSQGTGSQWSLRDRSIDSVASVEKADAQSNGADPQALIDGFIASLRGSDLDREQQELLGQRFEDAVRDAAANPKPSEPLQRSDWLEAVDVLRKMGAIDESQGHALVRKLDEAMQPLLKRKAQLAIEFSRRCQEDPEKALEWFRAQSADIQQDSAASGEVPPPAWDSTQAADLITNSRSRRLRGPPSR